MQVESIMGQSQHTFQRWCDEECHVKEIELWRMHMSRFGM